MPVHPRSPLPPRPTAADVMTPEPVCVEPSTTIRQLARLFEEHDISGCPVVDQQGRLIGVVSKTDLIRRCAEGTPDRPPSYLFEVLFDTDTEVPMPEPLICVEDFMTEDPIAVPPNAPLAHVASLMAQSRVHRVVVVDQDRIPIGIITSLDMLRAFPS